MNTAPILADDDLPDGDDFEAMLGAPKDSTVNARFILAPATPARFEEKCEKCRGTGKFFNLRGTVVGTCYACKGSGKASFRTSPMARAKASVSRTARKVRSGVENLAAFKTAQPDVFAWFDGSAFPFAVSMRESVEKYGSLTDRQLAAAVTSVQKLADAKAARVTRVENAPTVDLTKIEAALTRAAQTVQKPKLRLAGLTISLASSASRNAGGYYVKQAERGYIGKIVGGKFIRASECTDADESHLLALANDPKAAAIAYGRITGQCSCCGRTLSNKESIELGIGPICAANFFG